MMKLTDLPSKIMVLLIMGWRYILRPLFPQNACRFEPSCSHYTEEAVREYGVIKGILLGAWRILRCNPWNKGGFDPVKPRKREEY
jgi:putative membrane protein insertion efficiency factor